MFIHQSLTAENKWRDKKIFENQLTSNVCRGGAEFIPFWAQMY